MRQGLISRALVPELSGVERRTALAMCGFLAAERVDCRIRVRSIATDNPTLVWTDRVCTGRYRHDGRIGGGTSQVSCTVTSASRVFYE